jgi:hypothetical protein
MRGSFVGLLAMVAFLPLSLYIARRMSRAYGIAIIVMAGSLFLPEGVVLLDLPLIPTIEKERLTYICALIAALFSYRQAYRDARPGAGPEIVFLLIVLALVGTLVTNKNQTTNYGTVQEPLGLYWLFARAVDDLITIMLPFVVGRTMFRSRGDLRVLAYVIVAAGLVYVPLIVLEALMSIPFGVWQLSLVFYGMPMQPSWRWGGIQPIVFMDNALSTASFMAVAVIMAAGVAASKAAMTWRGVRRAHAWTSLGLLLTRVSASNLYGIVFGGFLRFFNARRSSLLAVLIAAMVCAYPALRLADAFPYEELGQLAREYINDERAASFVGRFQQEDVVFAGLGDLFWFGWGTFDRIPVGHIPGQGLWVLDSLFVIRVGLTGIVGTQLIMLLMMVPVWLAWRRLRLLEGKEPQFLIAALMLCVAARMVDFLMNGLFNCLPFFLAGALYGVAKSIGQPAGEWESQSTAVSTETARQRPGRVARRKKEKPTGGQKEAGSA